MKKPTLIALLLFVLTSFAAFSQGEWIEENYDPNSGLRTGKIRVNNSVYEIKPSISLRNANLNGANLSNANLRDSDLEWVSFSDANLRGANFRGCDLKRVSFIEADLRGANFSRTELVDNTDFSRSNASNADFKEAKFESVILTGAILKDINLTNTDVRGGNFPDK